MLTRSYSNGLKAVGNLDGISLMGFGVIWVWGHFPFSSEWTVPHLGPPGSLAVTQRASGSCGLGHSLH